MEGSDVFLSSDLDIISTAACNMYRKYQAKPELQVMGVAVAPISDNLPMTQHHIEIRFLLSVIIT